MSRAAQPDDDSPARRVLERLLRRAEAAALKGDARPASLSMNGQRDGADYLALEGVADFDAFHARIALAERAGAISVERARHRDDGERLLRLTVHDLAALAAELGLEPASQRLARAEALLAPWLPCRDARNPTSDRTGVRRSGGRSDVSRDEAFPMSPPGQPSTEPDRDSRRSYNCSDSLDAIACTPGNERSVFPVLNEVLAVWRAGRKLRGHGPEAAADLADAARAVATLQADSRSERILRRASAELFNDSKRLEKLTAWLDVVLSGELAPSGLEEEQLWAALGLHKEPQPLRLAGQGVVQLEDGSLHVLPRSWLGFPVEEVRGIRSDVRVLLSIENLASFHEAAAMRGDASLLLLYTGGMPSPAWCLAYARLLAGLPADALLYHWGDIDRGGFRIAARVAAIAREAGRQLQPWLMSAAQLPAQIIASAEKPTPAVLENMCDWAHRSGWEAVAQALQQTPLLLEQERLSAQLPTANPQPNGQPQTRGGNANHR